MKVARGSAVDHLALVLTPACALCASHCQKRGHKNEVCRVKLLKKKKTVPVGLCERSAEISLERLYFGVCKLLLLMRPHSKNAPDPDPCVFCQIQVFWLHKLRVFGSAV
jgi:hypothetical protein